MQPNEQLSSHELLGLQPSDQGGDSFAGLTVQGLELLIAQGFADPEECSDSGPSVGYFMSFLRSHPEFTVFGGIQGHPPDSSCIYIDGIECPEGLDSLSDLADFVNHFREADDFRIDPPYAWYD